MSLARWIRHIWRAHDLWRLLANRKQNIGIFLARFRQEAAKCDIDLEWAKTWAEALKQMCSQRSAAFRLTVGLQRMRTCVYSSCAELYSISRKVYVKSSAMNCPQNGPNCKVSKSVDIASKSIGTIRRLEMGIQKYGMRVPKCTPNILNCLLIMKVPAAYLCMPLSTRTYSWPTKICDWPIEVHKS